MAKRWTTPTTLSHGAHMHWFASSIAAWRVGEDMERLIAQMKRDDLPFNLWVVRLPVDADYRIEAYAPQLPADQVSFVAYFKQKGN